VGRARSWKCLGREERVVILHESVLTAAQTRVLRAVGPLARRAGFYLAGGTAMALRFGHRRSEDFDWFAPALSRPDALLSDLQAEGLSLQETQIEAGTVISRIEGVKISFFEYRYPLLDSLDQWPEYDTDIASLRDLGEMKLLAIAQRGSRKDFIDMYELLRNGVVLRRMLDAHGRIACGKEMSIFDRPLLYQLSLDDLRRMFFSQDFECLEQDMVFPLRAGEGSYCGLLLTNALGSYHHPKAVADMLEMAADVPDFLALFFSNHALRQGKKRWAEKTPRRH